MCDSLPFGHDGRLLFPGPGLDLGFEVIAKYAVEHRRASFASKDVRRPSSQTAESEFSSPWPGRRPAAGHCGRRWAGPPASRCPGCSSGRGQHPAAHRFRRRGRPAPAVPCLNGLPSWFQALMVASPCAILRGDGRQQLFEARLKFRKVARCDLDLFLRERLLDVADRSLRRCTGFVVTGRQGAARPRSAAARVNSTRPAISAGGRPHRCAPPGCSAEPRRCRETPRSSRPAPGPVRIEPPGRRRAAPLRGRAPALRLDAVTYLLRPRVGCQHAADVSPLGVCGFRRRGQRRDPRQPVLRRQHCRRGCRGRAAQCNRTPTHAQLSFMRMHMQKPRVLLCMQETRCASA